MERQADKSGMLEEVISQLNELGIRELEKTELQSLLEANCRAIEIGLKRKGKPTEEDGGCLAFNSLVHPLPEDVLERIAPGRKVVVGNFGGTNWQSKLAIFKEGEIKFLAGHEVFFPQKDREFENPESLAESMVNQLSQNIGGEKPKVVAISFGFQQEPVWTDYGLDAKVPTDEPAKYWKVQGLAGTKIGELIIKEAKKRGWEIEKIYITNDTIATALDLPGAFLGFVAGSGTNGCLTDERFRYGAFVNLESGALHTLPETEILKKMRDWGWLPEGDNYLEYSTGGDFLIKQLAATFKHLHLSYESLLDCSSKIVSYSAAFDKENVERLLGRGRGFELPHQEFLIIQETSRRILQRCGQIIGATVSAMIKVTRADQDLKIPLIPTEGSVIWKGTGVLDVAEKTIRDLLGIKAKNIFLPALGTRGIATFALFESDPLKY